MAFIPTRKVAEAFSKLKITIPQTLADWLTQEADRAALPVDEVVAQALTYARTHECGLKAAKNKRPLKTQPQVEA